MHDFKENISSFTGEQGVDIFYRHLPAGDEKTRLVIAHGLGEHSARYINLFNRLIPAGYSIWALDHRGHGRSQGKRGHIDAFDQYLLDLKKLIELSRKDAPPDCKLFLLGHSMGGLISLNYAERFSETIDGIIASSPGLGVNVQIPAAKALMGKVMSAIWPGLSLVNGLDSSKISHDGDTIAAYQDDPLVHDRVTARWFTEFFSALTEANANAFKIEVPVLMQVAGDDQLVKAQASKLFFNNLTVEDKTLHWYDRLYHEIYNELPADRDVVIDDLENWLEAHI